MNLTVKDLRIGDIYEATNGRFFKIVSIEKSGKSFIGDRLNSEMTQGVHKLEDIKNYFRMQAISEQNI